MALSGGQKQRVLLARALYRRPFLVFLDEAFDQIDFALERKISDALTRDGFTVALVSHRRETVAVAKNHVTLGTQRDEVTA